MHDDTQSTAAADARMVFADCQIDPARREVHRDGELIVVQPRVFNLLAYLIEHRDRAVDKDELQDAIWPGMIVTETALTRAVMKARRAIGDDAGTQRYIKTLHGHGYRFIADVSFPDRSPAPPLPLAESEPPDATPADAVPASSRRWWAAVVVAIIALTAWLVLRPPFDATSGARIAVLPLHNATGDAELGWTRLGVMSLVSGLIANGGELALIPDAHVVGLVDGLSDSEADGQGAEGELFSKLREAYGATHIVSMQLEKAAGGMRMNYRVIAPDGKEQRNTMVGEEVTALASAVAHNAFPLITGQRRMGSTIPVISEDPFINEAYARGKDFGLSGRCAEAVPLLKVVVDQEPALFLPLFEYASCERILGNVKGAEAMLESLVVEQRGLGASIALARALKELGVLYIRTGRQDKALATLNEGLDVAAVIDDQDIAGDLLINLSIVERNRSSFDAAGEFLGRAMLAYEQAGRERTPGGLYSAQANLAMNQGKLADAELHLQNALAEFRFVGDQRREAMMLNNTGYLLRNQGRLAEAEEFHLQSLAIREQIGDRVGVGRIYNMLAVLYHDTGRLQEARSAAVKALESATDANDRLFMATANAQLAAAQLSLSDIDAAREHYRVSNQLFVEIQDNMRVLQTDLALARIDLRMGDIDGAALVAERVYKSARDAHINQAEVEALELTADVALKRGDFEASVAVYRDALQRVRDLSWDGKETDLVVKLAQAYLDQNLLADAEPLVGAVTQQPQDATTLKLRARYAFMNADAEQAARLMTDARAAARERWAEDDETQLNLYVAAQIPNEDASNRVNSQTRD